MKYCEECGQQIEDIDEFCTECGAKQEEVNKYCEECGAEIEQGDSFCQNCGWNIYNNDEDVKSFDNKEITEEFDIVEEDEQIPEEHKTKRNIVKPLLIIVLLITIISIGVLGYFHFSDRDTETNDAFTEPTTESESETNVEESETEESETKESETEESDTVESESESDKSIVDVNDYLGYWYMNGLDDNELAILGIVNDKIEFSLLYYRLTSMDNVIATLDGNTASFSYLDVGTDMVKGTLVFNKDSITVKITESESDYIPVETMIFNSQEHQVTEYENYGTDNADGFIIYDSDSRYVSESDLYGLSANELLIARNEIYARKGRGFHDTSIQSYFNSQSWYVQLYSPEEFDAMGRSMLNDYEYQNVLTIRNYETEQGY